MIGSSDIRYLSGKLSGLAEIQAISFGVKMKTIYNDPMSIKAALQKARVKKMKTPTEQIGYDEMIDTVLANSPAELMDW